MKFDLRDSAQMNILVVAHRGSAAGNIPCNTIPAFEAALRQGADMIEIDVEMSADGKLYIFHPGMEPHHLYHLDRIKRMKSEDVERLRFINYDRVYTQFPVNTFDDLLETFKGRCYINVDKFWNHPKEIYEAIKRHGMQDQIVVKSSPSEQVFALMEEMAPELSYMPIVQGTHPLHEQLMKRSFNYIGAEVIFKTDDDEVASPAFIEKMHRDNKLLWVNAIIYNYKEQLTAGHSDDTAICTDPELGWGWLARRGFDMIQTDWTGMLISYLKQTGLYYR
jgi:glycerophosphoryl diester phosphodiesterase